MKLSSRQASRLVEAAHSSEPVSGLTHNFYKYPARFPPQFVRTAIEIFTQPGELVIDPFMGGGTTLVEARALGRHSVGIDVNELAAFVTRVKTRSYSDDELESVSKWINRLSEEVNCQQPPRRPYQWIESGYQRHLDRRDTWRIRKTVEIALSRLPELNSPREEDLARCVLLRTGQWALDCKKEIPAVGDFREKLKEVSVEMCRRAEEYRAVVQDVQVDDDGEIVSPTVRSLCGSAADLPEKCPSLSSAPSLILTSPPYPGVHVLYHRWQVYGRKETPAPYWIANCRDGQGESFYTMGGRHQSGLRKYFDELVSTYSTLTSIADEETTFVTVISFSEPDWQLPKFLKSLESCGLYEVQPTQMESATGGRIEREVPNRKWYNETRDKDIPSGSELVLVHKYQG